MMQMKQGIFRFRRFMGEYNPWDLPPVKKLIWHLSACGYLPLVWRLFFTDEHE